MSHKKQKAFDCRLVIYAALMTIVFELITCVMRFGLQLESTRDTASTVGRLTCGIRIHHSYIGAMAILISCWLWRKMPDASWWLLVIGLGLFFSDLIHHFLVLWPITGSPEFDFVY